MCMCSRFVAASHRKEKSPNLAGTFHQWFSSMDHGLSAGNLLSSRLVHFSRCLCAVCVCARLTSSVACCSCVRVRLSSPMRHTSFLHYHYAFVHCVSSVLPSTQWRRFLDEIKKQEVLETWMRSGPFGRAERVYECASECVYVFCSVNIEQEIIGYRHLQLTFMCTSYNDTLSDARTNAHGMRPNFGWVLSVCCSSSSRLYHR